MLALYSDPRLLSVVRWAVERLAETLGCPAVQCRSITRAVDEAVTNIVRHSYGNRLDQPIAMYFRRAQRRRERGETGATIPRSPVFRYYVSITSISRSFPQRSRKILPAPPEGLELMIA